MVTVLVPVRYPLSSHSRHTLSRAIETAEERDGTLVVLHVDLYQNGDGVDRPTLKRGIEAQMDLPTNTRFLVRKGFLVEETILEEIAAEEADIVVIGHKQLGRWRRTLRRLRSDPDIESYLRERVDCELVTVPPP